MKAGRLSGLQYVTKTTCGCLQLNKETTKTTLDAPKILSLLALIYNDFLKMATIEQQIKALQDKLKLQNEDNAFLANAQELLNGKYFLDSINDRGYGKNMRCLNLTFIKEVKSLGSDGKLVIDGKSLDLQCLPPKLLNENRYVKTLKPVFGHLQIQANTWNFINFRGVKRTKDKASLSDFVVEITKSQAFHILDSLMEIQTSVFNKIENIFLTPKPITEDYVGINLQDLMEFKEIDKYLKTNPIPVKEIKSKYRTVIENRFNHKHELESLVQYDLAGENGLYLNIVGGDDGTDYEPYVTRYDLEQVKIKWEEILYPIRLKLNCKVFELVEKLESLSSVYNTGNWQVNYSGSYDVNFTSANLNASGLIQINNLIKEHLK